MKATFSIVICTYNGENTLEKTLDAIIKQKGFNELVEEIIVVDNASTDNTREIVFRYIKNNDKIIYIYEEKPGLSNARRHGVEAIAPWVLYVDDDNVLAENWLEEAVKVIENNPQIGIINGAVIGVPVDAISEKEAIRFEAMYSNLACTHIYKFTENEKIVKVPMGAGLCIITEALREVNRNGWLKLTGRKGEELSSGEDSELCNKVMQQGYKYIRDYNLRLEHLIPGSRLSEEYTLNLLKNLVLSKYILVSNKKHYIIGRILRIIKYIIIMCVIKIKKIFVKENPKQREKNRQFIIMSTVFIKCTLKDFFVLRK